EACSALIGASPSNVALGGISAARRASFWRLTCVGGSPQIGGMNCFTGIVGFWMVMGLTAVLGDDSGGFRPLFNGENLDGWINVNCAPSTWKMEDGILKCSGKPIGEIRTERMYQNFVLELEWRHLVPKGNAGVFVWADDITARGQPFIRGIEVQVLENAYGNSRNYTTHGDIFPIHGAKMTPVNGRGGSRAFPTENRSNPSPEWNHYRITCEDGSIALEVNGKLVTQGNECRPKKGYICLESEGGVVEYRNVQIRELPKTPIDPEDVAIADRGYRVLYNGVDFAGWEPPAEDWKAADWELIWTGDGTGEPLRTRETFGDFGFVFDVLLEKGSGVPRLKLRGDGEGIAIDPASLHLAKPGQWNRFQGEVRGNVIVGTINDKMWRQVVDGEASRGRISIYPAKKVRFANLYVRDLD
ncbi:MAG: family 16 glycoside hydrolase, partial [Verrucomicrobiota bacterium]